MFCLSSLILKHILSRLIKPTSNRIVHKDELAENVIYEIEKDDIRREKEERIFKLWDIESSSCLHCEFLFLFVTVYRPWTNFFLRSIAIFSTAIEILMFNSLMIILWYDSSMIKYKIVKIKKKIYKNIILFVSCMCKKDSIR